MEAESTVSMSPLVILSIAVSSVAWSLFDMSRKKLATRLEPIPVVVWLMLLQTPLFAALAIRESWGPLPSEYFVPALASLTLNCLANVWFIQSVSVAPLSLVIPVLSLTPVFSAMGGMLLLSEAVTLRQATGIAIIVATTFAIARLGSRDGSHADPKAVRKGVLFMAGVALLWATTPVLDKLCLRSVPASEHAFLQCLGVSGLLYGWILVRKGRVGLMRSSDLTRNFKWFTLAVSVAAIALFLQFWSLRHVPVGIFEALKRSYGLLSALGLGYLVFREPVTRAKGILVVAMGLGIFVLLT